MPFSRNHLVKQIKKNYRDLGIILHPIQHEYVEWGEEWIKPLLYTEKDSFDICYSKLNFFKRNNNIIDDDYYWVQGDDDLIEPELIEKIKSMNYDVIVVSEKTGTDVPTSGSNCEIGILWAIPENMKKWGVGLAQIVMKGKFFKEAMYREDTNIGDGYMGEYVKEHYNVHYEPELFVKHNYYQPGRWERLGDEKFIEE
jgi:hypothetical protein